MIMVWQPVSRHMVVFEVYLLIPKVHLRKDRCSLLTLSVAIFGGYECQECQDAEDWFGWCKANMI